MFSVEVQRARLKIGCGRLKSFLVSSDMLMPPQLRSVLLGAPSSHSPNVVNCECRATMGGAHGGTPLQLFHSSDGFKINPTFLF